jgi:hypothetical protein
MQLLAGSAIMIDMIIIDYKIWIYAHLAAQFLRADSGDSDGLCIVLEYFKEIKINEFWVTQP